MGVGTQKIEGRFVVRNVTKPIVAARQVMDRGEVEVEEERQARVKSAPVLPTDRERSTRSRMRRFAAGARRVWQDVRQKIRHKRSATEPSVPVAAMEHGFHGRGVATILVLIQRPLGAAGACQVLRKGPEPYAIDCVLAYLDTWGLREKCCSRQTMSQPSRHSSTRFESDGARGRWWKRVRSTRISQMVRLRLQCEGSRASRELSCVCCRRSLATKSTARALTVACQARGVRAQSICEAR